MTHGILLLDKPRGLSSNSALQRVRRAFGRVKAGHTGSLDPLATGMLPICLGEATKVAGYLLEGDKQYLFTAAFGSRTATGDLEGAVEEVCAVPDDLAAVLQAAVARFLGPQSQIPPMYSALKRDGQPLYKLARAGLTVERAARSIHIHALELLAVAGHEAQLRVRCSKGTYVRTLAEDLAHAIGTTAHLSMLRRESVEPFAQESMVTLDALEAAPAAVRLVAPDLALPHLSAVQLGAAQTRQIGQGQQIVPASLVPGATGLVRMYGPGRFLGIGRLEASGGDAVRLQPVRLFNDLAAESLEARGADE
jgi:tRNA pseudouridine55 synthase